MTQACPGHPWCGQVAGFNGNVHQSHNGTDNLPSLVPRVVSTVFLLVLGKSLVRAAPIQHSYNSSTSCLFPGQALDTPGCPIQICPFIQDPIPHLHNQRADRDPAVVSPLPQMWPLAEMQGRFGYAPPPVAASSPVLRHSCPGT